MSSVAKWKPGVAEAGVLDHFSAKKAVWLFVHPFEDLSENVDLTRFGEMLAEPRTDTMMIMWKWCSPFETTKNLTRPEVARYVIQMTKELADLLGVPLKEEGQHG